MMSGFFLGSLAGCVVGVVVCFCLERAVARRKSKWEPIYETDIRDWLAYKVVVPGHPGIDGARQMEVARKIIEESGITPGQSRAANQEERFAYLWGFQDGLDCYAWHACRHFALFDAYEINCALKGEPPEAVRARRRLIGMAVDEVSSAGRVVNQRSDHPELIA